MRRSATDAPLLTNQLAAFAADSLLDMASVNVQCGALATGPDYFSPAEGGTGLSRTVWGPILNDIGFRSVRVQYGLSGNGETPIYTYLSSLGIKAAFQYWDSAPPGASSPGYNEMVAGFPVPAWLEGLNEPDNEWPGGSTKNPHTIFGTYQGVWTSGGRTTTPADGTYHIGDVVLVSSNGNYAMACIQTHAPVAGNKPTDSVSFGNAFWIPGYAYDTQKATAVWVATTASVSGWSGVPIVGPTTNAAENPLFGYLPSTQYNNQHEYTFYTGPESHRTSGALMAPSLITSTPLTAITECGAYRSNSVPDGYAQMDNASAATYATRWYLAGFAAGMWKVAYYELLEQWNSPVYNNGTPAVHAGLVYNTSGTSGMAAGTYKPAATWLKRMFSIFSDPGSTKRGSRLKAIWSGNTGSLNQVLAQKGNGHLLLACWLNVECVSNASNTVTAPSGLIFPPLAGSGAQAQAGQPYGDTFPGFLPVSGATFSAGHMTLTVPTGHGRVTGETIVVSGVAGFGGTPANGTFIITGTGSTTIVYAIAGVTGSYSSGGTVAFYSAGKNLNGTLNQDAVVTFDQTFSNVLLWQPDQSASSTSLGSLAAGVALPMTAATSRPLNERIQILELVP